MNNIINSVISEDATLFNNIRIEDSVIKSGCTVGDDCDIQQLVMMDRSELGRRNLIRNSLVGKGSYTGTNTIIKNTDVGRYSCISWNVSIGGGNHNYLHVSMYTDYWYQRTFGISNNNTTDESKGRTIIGNDVWIGTGAIVLDGVEVGDGCVIGAGTIITKSIPSYSIVIGSPGKVIRKRFDDSIIELLERIKWWNWSEEKIKKNINLLKNEPTKENLLRYIDEKSEIQNINQ